MDPWNGACLQRHECRKPMMWSSQASIDNQIQNFNTQNSEWLRTTQCASDDIISIIPCEEERDPDVRYIQGDILVVGGGFGGTCEDTDVGIQIDVLFHFTLTSFRLLFFYGEIILET